MLWGILHVVGGASLISMEATEGLETLGPNAPTAVPADLGESAAALLHFHGFNVAAGGLAVLTLALAWQRSRSTWQAAVAMGIATVLDIGLLLYIVAPGLLPASQGLLGPGLLVVAVVGYVSHVPRRRGVATTPGLAS